MRIWACTSFRCSLPTAPSRRPKVSPPSPSEFADAGNTPAGVARGAAVSRTMSVGVEVYNQKTCSTCRQHHIGGRLQKFARAGLGARRAAKRACRFAPSSPPLPSPPNLLMQGTLLPGSREGLRCLAQCWLEWSFTKVGEHVRMDAHLENAQQTYCIAAETVPIGFGRRKRVFTGLSNPRSLALSFISLVGGVI